MATFKYLRPRRLSRTETFSAMAILVAITVYFLILHALDGRAAAYFEQLRKDDPDLYLSQLRESRGFDAYLSEYRAAKGYDEFRRNTPEFLVGRWTMRGEPLRIVPGSKPEECSDPVTFEFGMLLIRDNGGNANPVSYRIEGDTVEMQLGIGWTVPVTLVSYGSLIDHIVFQPPGRKAPVYAYRCG